VLDRHIARVCEKPSDSFDADSLLPDDGSLCVPFEQRVKNPDALIVR
jgi:hypothetical protein